MTSSIIWHRLDLPGHEIGRLVLRDNYRELSGTAIFASKTGPCKLDYLVLCDTGWRTRSARVTGVVGDREIDLRVSVDEEHRWRSIWGTSLIIVLNRGGFLAIWYPSFCS